jgi:hypothetical protein
MIRLTKDATVHEIPYWNPQKLTAYTGVIYSRNKPTNLPITVAGWLIEEVEDTPIPLTLDQVKSNKSSELNLAMENSKTETVTVETYTWYKDRAKTQLQHEAIQLAELKSETTVNLIDSSNQVRNLTVTQAKNVIIASAEGYAANYWNLQTKLAQVAAATDIETVNAITW